MLKPQLGLGPAEPATVPPDRQQTPTHCGPPAPVRAPGADGSRAAAEPRAVVGALGDPAVWRAIAEHAATQALEHPAGWRSLGAPAGRGGQ